MKKFEDYNVGDLAVVVDCICGHRFDMGEKVEVVAKDEISLAVQSLHNPDEAKWLVCDDEIVPYCKHIYAVGDTAYTNGIDYCNHGLEEGVKVTIEKVDKKGRVIKVRTDYGLERWLENEELTPAVKPFKIGDFVSDVEDEYVFVIESYLDEDYVNANAKYFKKLTEKEKEDFIKKNDLVNVNIWVSFKGLRESVEALGELTHKGYTMYSILDDVLKGIIARQQK